MHNSKMLVKHTIQKGKGGQAILAALLLGSMPDWQLIMDL